MSVEEFCDPHQTAQLTAMANQVIIDESPVSYSLIGKRIMESCGITKNSAKVKERVDYIIRATRVKPAPDGSTVFFWKSGSDPMAYDFYRYPSDDYVREPDEVHSSEAACAMLEAIAEQYGMPEESAFAAGARKLGFARMTPSVRELMEKGMDILKDENAVTLDEHGMLQQNNVL